jgi:hypothetical protein
VDTTADVSYPTRVPFQHRPLRSPTCRKSFSSLLACIVTIRVHPGEEPYRSPTPRPFFAVAAQGSDQLLDRPPGLSFKPAGDGQGGEHDCEVGLDRILLVVVDQPRAEVGLGHAEALLDLL